MLTRIGNIIITIYETRFISLIILVKSDLFVLVNQV